MGSSAAAGACNHDFDGLDQNEQIAGKSPFPHILAVEPDALVVIDIAAAAYLPQAGDAGARRRIVLDLGSVADHFVLHDGAGTDQAHLAADNIDELPQLINVIRGEMSLVGPRPIVQDEVIRYAAEIEHYAATRPGITGLWQVCGRSDVDYDQRVRLDSQYVREWTFAGDLLILIKTVKVVIARTGSR